MAIGSCLFILSWDVVLALDGFVVGEGGAYMGERAVLEQGRMNLELPKEESRR